MPSHAEIAETFVAAMDADRADRTRRALAVLLPAMAGAPIYGGEFTDAKTTLDRTFEQSFRSLRDRHHAPRYDAGGNVTPVGAINDSLGYASGLRSSLAMAKKAAKLRIADPYLGVVREFLSAAVPMAELMEALKGKVIKGRRPAAVSSQEKRLAGRVGGSGTCQICGGSQAIVRGKISLHGYNRPGLGFITDQCWGSGELAFEVSCDALRKWIGKLRTFQTRAHDELLNLPARAELLIEVRVFERGKYTTKPEVITAADPRFEQARENKRRELEHQIDALIRERERQQKRLDGWAPVPGWAPK